MHSLIRKFFQSDFLRNSSILTIASIASQSIGIISVFFLTRIYTVEAFGQWAIFMSVIGMLSVIGTFRFEVAFVTAKDDQELGGLLAGSLSILFCLTGIAMIINYALTSYLIDFVALFSVKDYSSVLPFIPFMFFMVVLNNIMFNYFIKRNSFKYNAILRVVKACVTAFSAIYLGYQFNDSNGLIYGSIIGQSLSILSIFPFVVKDWKGLLGNVSIGNIRNSLANNREFALVNTPNVVLDKVQNDGFLFLIAWLFSEFVLGAYSFVVKIVKTPLGIISQAVSQAFFRQVSVSNPAGRRRLLVQLLKFSSIGFFVSIITLPFIPYLFNLFFGNDWVEAGYYCQILLPYFYISFVVSVLSSITIVVKEQKNAFLFSFVGGVIRIAALFVGFYYESFLISLFSLAIVHSILLLIALGWYYKISAKDFFQV